MHTIDVLQANLIQAKLLDEGGPDLQIGPSTIQELERLKEGPLVLAHEVAGQCACRTALAPHRVHQN